MKKATKRTKLEKAYARMARTPQGGFGGRTTERRSYSPGANNRSARKAMIKRRSSAELKSRLHFRIPY